MKIAAYCRVSTARINQLESLSNQKEFFVGYAKAHNHELIQIYADEGISGKQMKNRTEFLKMLEDAKEGKFDAIVVKDISRFSRNTLDFLIAIRTLKSIGVDVVFLSNNMSVLGNGELFLTMHSAIAQEESLNLSNRIKFGKRVNAQKGRVPTSIFGYDRVDNFNLKINEQEAEVVQKIFNLYTKSGYSKSEIARFLNENGYKAKRLSSFSAKTISRIMSNPIYCGILLNNKYKTIDYINGEVKINEKSDWFYHERPEYKIISKKQFDLANNCPNLSNSNNIKCKVLNLNTLFRGKIICKQCGKSYIKRSYCYKNLHIKFVCSKHHKGEGCDNKISLDLFELLAQMKNYVNLNYADIHISKQEVKKAFFNYFDAYNLIENENITNILENFDKSNIIISFNDYLYKNYRELTRSETTNKGVIQHIFMMLKNDEKCRNNVVFKQIENYTTKNAKSIENLLDFLFLLSFIDLFVDKIIISKDGEVEIKFNSSI